MLMRGAQVLDWLVWWTQGEMRFRGAYGFGSATGLSSNVRLWAQSGGHAGYRLAVEGLRAYPGKSNHQAMLKLAYAAGEVSGVLRPGSEGELMRPLSTTWRPMVLGLPQRCKAADAEAYAVKMAPGLFTWTARWPEDLRKDARGALAEAACIARWGTLAGG